jgi:rubrerythrin
MSRLIDADALDAKIYNDIPIKVFGTVARMANMRELVNKQPTIDAVPVVHGKWEYSENIYDESTWVCSICKEPWTLIDGTPQENGMKYCPNCGAKMDLEDEQ